MKFQKLDLLEKNFQPSHLSSIYVVICPQDGERKKILEGLLEKLQSLCDAKKCLTIQDAIAHLEGGSLFSGKVASYFDGLDQLVKGEMELLARYARSPNPNAYLLLGSTSVKSTTDLYKIGKKEMVILDLSKEKPWEEKDRHAKWVVASFSKAKKRISPQALATLMQRLPSDRLLLQQEIDKLLCFCADKEEISQKDVEAISSISHEMNLFHLARELVWGQRKTTPNLSDVSFLIPLVSQLRSQMEIGLKMGALLRRKASQEEISKSFPRLFPKALIEAQEGSLRKGEAYFRNGLLDLFELEFGLKTSLARPEVLFTRFCAKCLQ